MPCGAALKVGIDDVSMPELRAKAAQQVRPGLSASSRAQQGGF